MTVPVRSTGVAAVGIALGEGVPVLVCDGGSLGDVDSVTLGAPVPLPASLPQPTSRTAHAASTAMMRIEIISLRAPTVQRDGQVSRPRHPSVSAAIQKGVAGKFLWVECLIDLVEVEVRGVFEDLREICCFPKSATIFRWCGAAAVDTHGDGCGLLKRKDRLQRDDQVP